MPVRIAIDAGHGGYDNGATYQGRREKDDNLDIALAVGEILEQNGVEVVYTRVTDVYDSPVRKAQIANEAGADYFISIHRNSSPNTNMYSGVETLVYDDTGIKAEMARQINEQLAQVGFNNLGVNERRDLAVLRRTQMPALLVEVGFINTDADNALLDANFEETAQAIADGILNTLGIRNEIEGNVPEAGEGMPVYRVQIGLFRNSINANNVAGRLEALGIPVSVEMRGSLYAVIAGDGESLENTVLLEQDLQQLGFDTLIVTS